MLAVLVLTIKDQDWGVWGEKKARCGPESCDYGSDHPDPCRLNKEEGSRERWILRRGTTDSLEDRLKDKQEVGEMHREWPPFSAQSHKVKRLQIKIRALVEIF